MEEIGRRLQAARLAKGITLEEVEEQTRIRKKYLEALESGRTVLIPGEVYVKGFLRSYGNFLGLDGDALVEEYKARKSRPPVEDAADSSPADRSGGEPEAHVASSAARPSAEPRQPAFVTPPRRTSRSRTKRRKGGPGPGVYFVRRLMVALILILPLAGLGYWFWGREASAPVTPPSEPAVQEPGPAETQPEPQSEPQPQPQPEPQPEPEPPKPVITVGTPRGEDVDITVTAEAIDLRMDFTADTWLAVYDKDGKELYYGMANGPVAFQGEAFRVRLGNVWSFSMTLNGEPVEHGLEGGPYWLNIRTE